MNKFQKHLDASRPKKFKPTVVLKWVHPNNYVHIAYGDGTQYTISIPDVHGHHPDKWEGTIHLTHRNREFKFYRDTLEEAMTKCSDFENTYDPTIRGRSSAEIFQPKC